MSELISDKDQRLAEFIRSKINLPNWSMTMAVRAFLQSENPKQEMEDEIILGYLNSFAYTIKLWVSSKQEVRISETIDKFVCIITAYLNGRLDSK